MIKKITKYLLSILVPLIISFVTYYGYYNFFNSGEIPVIYPDSKEFKTTPKFKDNLIHHYSGKTVYENLIKNNANKNNKIKFSPEPEKPILFKEQKNNIDVFAAATSIKQKNSSVFDKLSQQTQSDVKTKKNNEIKAYNQKLNITSSSENTSRSIAIDKVEKHKFYVQLAYSRQKNDISAQIEKILINNKFLNKYNYGIYKDKKNDKIFYELLIGPFDDFKKAKLICTHVKLQKNKCIIVRK